MCSADCGEVALSQGVVIKCRLNVLGQCSGEQDDLL